MVGSEIDADADMMEVASRGVFVVVIIAAAIASCSLDVLDTTATAAACRVVDSAPAPDPYKSVRHPCSSNMFGMAMHAELDIEDEGTVVVDDDNEADLLELPRSGIGYS